MSGCSYHRSYDLRESKHTRSDGRVVRYLQLAENVWNAEKGRSQASIIHGNDGSLTAEDMALGYKQQQRVEEAWRTMKSGLKLRPVYHWAVHRIHAHVAITVLSLLLERTIEYACQDTWRTIRDGFSWPYC
ncbi:MAG: hypothetical protein LBI59_08195 [Candidatus Accumulibacter sp.]|nr:hypothetical protein [Accumulibacter sp.]